MTRIALTHHLDWGAERLWHALSPLLPHLDIEVVARCESTNTALLQRARESSGAQPRARSSSDRAGRAEGGRRSDDAGPWLLVAEDQTAGRGRLGRAWHSAAGASLTFSLALAFAPRDWSGLSLAVGVALAEALDPLAPGQAPRLMLKWPNDLWWHDGEGRGRKLGGILIETTSVGPHRLAVVGIGLNVHPLPDTMLSADRASLQELHEGLDAPATLHRVAPAVARALREFETQGFAAFATRYAARDLLAGRPVTTTSPQAPEGVALGVAEDGALRLRTPQGNELRIASGEVSVRPASR